MSEGQTLNSRASQSKDEAKILCIKERDENIERCECCFYI